MGGRLLLKRRTAALRGGAAIVLIAAAISCVSCAYYNTFFFAKKYYNEAERARETRRDNQPTSQEIGLYEKCIKQCSKVIAQYPNSQYVDDALFLMATCYYHWGRYNDAMDWYQQLQESYPESEKARDVRYMTALCHLELSEYVDAENILTEMLKSAKGEEKEKIMFSLAEVSASRDEMDRAVRHLRELLAENPSDRLKLEAHLALGDAYFSAGAYDSAAMSYGEVATRSGQREQRVEARKRMGQAWQARGDYETALDIYSDILLTVESPAGAVQRDPQEATLLLRMGECYNSLGEHEKAVELFDRVMEDFQKTSFAAEAEYLKGFTYEIYYEDLTRAKTSYDRVSSHFQRSVFVDQAERRSEGIGKLMQYLEEGGQLEERAEGESAFLSAELNLFQLNKPDKALEVYRGVEKTYPDSPLAAKAAYAVAWVLINKLDREEEGMQEYRRIVERYPYTDYADAARRKLGLKPIAAQMQGPPLPKGWVEPDSSVIRRLGESIPEAGQAPGTGAADTAKVGLGQAGTGDLNAATPPVPNAVAPDTSGAAPSPADTPADTSAAGDIFVPDSTAAGAAPPDSARGGSPPDSARGGAR